MHPQLRKIMCSFSSYIPTIVNQLIVKNMSCIHVHRCLLLLWSVKPLYLRMTRRNKLQYLIHIQDWVRAVVFHRSKCQSSFFCSTLEYYPLYVRNVMGVAHHLMNSCYSDTSHHHYLFLGLRVVVTGMPTSEPWCVKSILPATLLLGS
jgi:hypothetical protein